MPRRTPSRLLVLDPGLHTGLALFTRGSDTTGWGANGETITTASWFLRATAVLALQPRVPGAVEWVASAVLYRLNGQGPDTALVVESFATARPLTADGALTLRIIGALEALGALEDAEVTLQAPPVRVPFLSSARQLAPRGTSRHEKDAVAHGVAFLVRRSLASVEDIHADIQRDPDPDPDSDPDPSTPSPAVS